MFKVQINKSIATSAASRGQWWRVDVPAQEDRQAVEVLALDLRVPAYRPLAAFAGVLHLKRTSASDLLWYG